jgi:hypothetical protein
MPGKEKTPLTIEMRGFFLQGMTLLRRKKRRKVKNH